MESTLDSKDEGWRLEDPFLVPVMANEELARDELLQIIRSNCLSSDVETSVQWKLFLPLHSIGLKCVAACRGYPKTDFQNGITSEVFVERQHDIKDKFDNNIFDDIFSFWFFTIL